MQSTRERAIAGVTSGLIGPDQEVTWEGRHFGVRFRFTSRITAFRQPSYFQDSMISGPFADFVHDHSFELRDGCTVMQDEVRFRSPLGLLGGLVDRFVLEPHLRRLLRRRNQALKLAAERAAKSSAA
jgi:ligand-binding SRPBCC domain-containing protein